MNTALMEAPPVSIEASPPDLLASFFGKYGPRTREAYLAGLRDFARHLGAPDVPTAARWLLACSHGQANHAALRYQTALKARGLAPATVNLRLTAVRALVALAQRLGTIPWSISLDSLPVERYRETAGPGLPAVRAVLSELAARPGIKARRDLAMIRLMADCALRREEVRSLDFEHLRLDVPEILILGKGRLQRERITLPAPTAAALLAWLAVRPEVPGCRAVFVNLAPRCEPGRLTGRGIHAVVRAVFARSGVRTWPHALRHTSITAACDMGLPDRDVQKFSRHKNVNIIGIYNDNREDKQGSIAALVAAGNGGTR